MTVENIVSTASMTVMPVLPMRTDSASDTIVSMTPIRISPSAKISAAMIITTTEAKPFPMPRQNTDIDVRALL